MKDLTKQKQAKVNGSQDKIGNCLTEKEIWNRWVEHCFYLYNYQSNMDLSAFSVWQYTYEDDFPILWAEVKTTLKACKKRKSARIDNTPRELLNIVESQ